MTDQKTHRLQINPRMTVRDLADYMAASETAQRTVVRDCRFQARARVIQHDEAKSTVSKFIRDKDTDVGWLYEEAARIRERMADSSFERDLFDHNAYYIQRFADIWPGIANKMPGTPSALGKVPGIVLHGVRISMDLHIRLSRVDRKNKSKAGGVMLRYAKNVPLRQDVADWQSAFLFGYLRNTLTPEESEPELGLCLTLDAFAGKWYPAPTNSISRFNQMKSACATIAERWPNVKPPPNAIY